MIRLLIADDHLIVRQGLRLILETEPGFELIGEAGDGAEAVELATELQPDVILMDLQMPERLFGFRLSPLGSGGHFFRSLFFFL